MIIKIPEVNIALHAHITKEHHFRMQPYLKIQGCIQKFLDWVDNKINNDDNKHPLRSNTKGYGGKTH
jgi:hypothetical protein